jgi:predicted ABC-type ATPase
MAELNETRAHIERDKQMRGDTKTRFRDDSRANGYTKDRAHLQKAIIQHGRRGPDSEHPGQTKMYEGLLSAEAIKRAKPEPGQQPELTLLGGRGGSGKSWFKDKLYDSKHALVLDATMKSGPGLLARAQAFKKAGYKVNAHYMHLPRLKAAQRAIGRRFSPGIEAAKKGGDPTLRGRYVDPDVILSNKDNEKNFEALSHIADNWSAWDNDVGRNESPKLIARGGNY